ncbi:copia protein [Trichonephila clavipes]|nr:copia protein [Trichonephila clavipes]
MDEILQILREEEATLNLPIKTRMDGINSEAFYCKRKNEKQTRLCYICRKSNHLAKDCYYRNKNSPSTSQRNNSSRNGHVFTASHREEKLCDNIWILDSGASCHMAKESVWFKNISPEVMDIYLADKNSKMMSQGTGNVSAKTTTSSPRTGRIQIPVLELNDVQNQIPVRRSERLKSKLMSVHLVNNLPNSYFEAENSANWKNWKLAMENELDSLNKHKVWEIVQKPAKSKLIKTKWVYSLKQDDTGKNIKYKARLVAAGFNQIKNIDYSESYSPVVNIESFRLLIALAPKLKLNVNFFDVKTAYLYGDLEETVSGEHAGHSIRCIVLGFKHVLHQTSSMRSGIRKQRNLNGSSVNDNEVSRLHTFGPSKCHYEILNVRLFYDSNTSYERNSSPYNNTGVTQRLRDAS